MHHTSVMYTYFKCSQDTPSWLWQSGPSETSLCLGMPFSVSILSHELAALPHVALVHEGSSVFLEYSYEQELLSTIPVVSQSVVRLPSATPNDHNQLSLWLLWPAPQRQHVLIGVVSLSAHMSAVSYLYLISGEIRWVHWLITGCCPLELFPFSVVVAAVAISCLVFCPVWCILTCRHSLLTVL